MTSKVKLSGLKIFKKLPNFLRKDKSNDNNEYENNDRQLRPADYEESEYEERPPIPEFVGGEEVDIQVDENIDDEDFETNSVGNQQQEYYVEEEDGFYGVESSRQQYYDPNMYPPPETDTRMRSMTMRTNGVPLAPAYMQPQIMQSRSDESPDNFAYNPRGPSRAAPYSMMEVPLSTRAPSGGFFPQQAAGPLPAQQQTAFTDSELMEFEQMVAHGMPEPEALRALQYNRMRQRSGRMVPPPSSAAALGPPSRGLSARGFTDYAPPVSDSGRSGYQLDEEEQLQIAMRASVEEENRRKQRIAQGDTSAKEAVERANERAMQLAIQRSYDEFERQQARQSAAAASGDGTAGCVQDLSSIEEANEKALKVAIMMSMAEASSSQSHMRSSSSENAPPPPSPVNALTPASRQVSASNGLYYTRPQQQQQQQMQQSQPQMIMGPPLQRMAVVSRAMSMGSDPIAAAVNNNRVMNNNSPLRSDINSRQPQQRQQQGSPAPFLHSQSQQYPPRPQALLQQSLQIPLPHLQRQQQEQIQSQQVQHTQHVATPQRFLQPKQIQRLISEETRNSSPTSSRHALAVEGNINSGSGSVCDGLSKFMPGLSLDVPIEAGNGQNSSPRNSGRNSFRICEQPQQQQRKVQSGRQTPQTPQLQLPSQQPATAASASSASSSAVGSPLITKFARPRAVMVQQIPPAAVQQQQPQRSKPRPGSYVEYEIEADDEVNEVDIPEVDDED